MDDDLSYDEQVTPTSSKVQDDTRSRTPSRMNPVQMSQSPSEPRFLAMDENNIVPIVLEILHNRKGGCPDLCEDVNVIIETILQNRKEEDDPQLIATLELATATKEGHLDGVCDAIARGGNFHLTYPTYQDVSWCLLTIAAHSGHMQLVRLFLDMGLPVEGSGTDKKTPLMYAAALNFVDIMVALLESGANPIAQANGYTPLDYAAQYGQDECLAILLDVIPPIPATYTSRTPVHAASLGGHVKVLQLLEKFGWSFSNHDNESGNTPLHYAVMSGNLDTVKYIAARIPDILIKNNKGQTALDIALMCGSHSVENWLVKNSIALLPDVSHHLQLMRIMQKHHESKYYDNIARIFKNDHTFAKEICGHITYSVDKYCMTFLHWAAYRGHHTVVHALLDSGQHPHVINFHGLTPEDLAHQEEHDRVIEVLQRHHCVQQNLSAEGKTENWKETGATAIGIPHISHSGQEQNKLFDTSSMNSYRLYNDLLNTISLKDDAMAVSRLLCEGAPLEPVDGFSISALHLAVTTDRSETVGLLLARGASLVQRINGLNLLQLAWHSPDTTPGMLATVTSAYTHRLRAEQIRLKSCTKDLVKGIEHALLRTEEYPPSDTANEMKFTSEDYSQIIEIMMKQRCKKHTVHLGIWNFNEDHSATLQENLEHISGAEAHIPSHELNEVHRRRLLAQQFHLENCSRKLVSGLKALLHDIEGNTPWKTLWGGGKESDPIVLTKYMVHAVRANCVLTVAFLRWAGAWPFLSGDWGVSALTAALECHQLRLAETLIRDLGGCPYVRDFNGCLPVTSVFMPVSLREDTEKMLYERERAHLEVMEIRAKCRRSKEAVHQALELQGELFRVYVKGQMHPGISINNARAPLILASRKGFMQLVHLIINVGHFPVNAVLDDTYNSTALHQAASHGQTSCVAVLLSSGGNVFPLDKYNQSPILLAAMFGHKNTFHFLSHREIMDAQRNKRDPCDPACRAGTTAVEVKKNFTSYLQRYKKCSHKARDFLTPVDRHDSERVARKILKTIRPRMLREEAQEAVVDFSRGTAHTVKEVVMTEVNGIMERVVHDDDSYRGELRLVGSAQDGSKLYAPDEYDINLVISGKDVKISMREEGEKIKAQYEGGLKISVKNTQFHENRMMEGFYHRIRSSLIDYVLQDKRLSLVPPGVTNTQVGVALSLAWQVSHGEEKNERETENSQKYPLLLIGVDLVPVLEVKWHGQISRPPLTPAHTTTMYLTNTDNGSWRCSFAQIEAEVLRKQRPDERLVHLMGKTLLSCLRADPWMPQERKIFCTWFIMRAWSIPAPSGFCFKNALLRWLEQRQQEGNEPIENPMKMLIKIFRSMCVHSNEPRGKLTPLSTRAYFGGECEGWKQGEGAPIIVQCLEEILEEEEGREEEADNGVEGEESEEDEDAGVKEEDFEEEEKH
ncbi:serine/threonine-protein phosphatase 6 regulatory ankyrin repeat subunit C-like isoform X2 [Scylla paramamosain]|uniref:serine/threonine-protein phosphatase 6 regulatory ankyrin repeat subunit C-like isoform X2 n=1 Tax=Scylla paramamosain TaxID=85552 RepID=UPI003082CA12